MKIQIASDLHTEMHPDSGLSLSKMLSSTGGADVLILAGDIGYLAPTNDYAYFLAKIKSIYELIIIVPGNHEYYKSDPDTCFNNSAALMQMFPMVKFLNNGQLIHKGQRFIGGTAWFPEPSVAEERNKIFMTDFRIIKNLEPYIYNQNAYIRKVLTSLENDDILITHHIPKSSIHPKYKYDALNPFFAHGLDSLIFGDNGPKLYVHGHTHEQMDYVRNKTRVVCNPLGYPSEVKQQNIFNYNLVIEV